jgi:hypothetical protein
MAQPRGGPIRPTDPYEVGIEHVREFASAIGDTKPLYRDRAAARAAGHPDVLAPPTFPFVLAFRATRQVIEDPELAIDYSRVVHGEQASSTPGRFAQVIASLQRSPSTASSRWVATRCSRRAATSRTVEGEHVVTAFSTLVIRGPEG